MTRTTTNASRRDDRSYPFVSPVSSRTRRVSRTDYAKFNAYGRTDEMKSNKNTPPNASDNIAELIKRIETNPGTIILNRLSLEDLNVYGPIASVALKPTGAIEIRTTRTRASSTQDDSTRSRNITKRTKNKKTVTEPVTETVTTDTVLFDVTDESTAHVATRRTALKRKNESVALELSGISPPKKVSEDHASIIEISCGEKEETTAVPSVVPVQATDIAVVSNEPISKPRNIHLFKSLIVSVKRTAPALTDILLKRLKYPELESAKEDTNESANVRRSSAASENRTAENSTKQSSRLRLSNKPRIVVSAPIAEICEPTDPEPVKIDSNGNNLLPPNVVGKRRIFKKAEQLMPPSLPLLIEEEDDESKGDVYEFLSLSQTSGEEKSSKKPSRKPRQKPAKRQGAIGPSKKEANAKKTIRKKNISRFGYDNKQLTRAIKRIGVGPVQAPATVDYIVNLELPKTPRECSPVAQLDHAAPLPVLPRAVNPAVERLKNGCIRQPNTSTPINNRGLVTFQQTEVPSVTPQYNPGSPWRVQNDVSIGRSFNMPRDKDMLPCYESLVEGTADVVHKPKPPAPTLLVTERRKLPTQKTTVRISASAQTSPPVRWSAEFPGGVLSDKNFREIERMYSELKATSELSEKLITVMRRYKAKLANDPTSPQQDRNEYESNMKEACAKLQQWYERSIKSMNRSMRIINRIQQATDNRASACPSPLSTDQQRTVDAFNQSTGRFRTMIDELHAAMNDSNVENRSPPSSKQPGPVSSLVADQTEPRQQPKQPVPKVTDVIVLPHRTSGVQRKPLMALNFVPLPQRNSPLMSPLAQPDGGVTVVKEKLTTVPDNNLRRKLQYENAREIVDTVSNTNMEPVESVEPVEPVEPLEPEDPVIPMESVELLEPTVMEGSAENEIIPETDIPEVGACEVVEVDDETPIDDRNNDDRQDLQRSDGTLYDANGSHGVSRDLFGFEDSSNSVDASQVTQVTLPMPFNISAETLKRRLHQAQRLIPKPTIFRQQPKPSGRSSGPTRFPAAHLRVFSSPTNRPHTLREFVASTPRAELSLLAARSATHAGPQVQTAGSSQSGEAAAPLEVPDVSAIEVADRTQSERPGRHDPEPEMMLFGTPEESRVNRSAHQRTYARIPRRKKKINIYLANLGLDDDEDVVSDENDSVTLSSDSDTAKTKKKKKKRFQQKKHRRKAKPVEESKEFREFVHGFNSMCEKVDQFEVIIE